MSLAIVLPPTTARFPSAEMKQFMQIVPSPLPGAIRTESSANAREDRVCQEFGEKWHQRKVGNERRISGTHRARQTDWAQPLPSGDARVDTEKIGVQTMMARHGTGRANAFFVKNKMFIYGCV
uniref:Uncharacterized protein n=1 Tax=Globodera rostochiensis TaxID=31243 RepID=A0A914I1M9_GLORO